MTTRSLATRRRPTTATTIADAANIDDDEVPSGGSRGPTANVNDDEADVHGRHQRQ